MERLRNRNSVICLNHKAFSLIQRAYCEPSCPTASHLAKLFLVIYSNLKLLHTYSASLFSKKCLFILSNIKLHRFFVLFLLKLPNSPTPAPIPLFPLSFTCDGCRVPLALALRRGQVVGSWGLLLPAWKRLRPLTGSHSHSHECVPLQMGSLAATLAHILTVTSRETLRQNHPALLLPNSWPTETVR